MQRIAALWHASPQKMVGVLFALLLAAAMAVGSGANFTSSSVNAGNLVTAGTLHASSGTGAVLSLDKIRPGESVTGDATISNTGNTQGAFTVTGSNLSNVAGQGPGNLSDQLDLTVQELDSSGNPVAGPSLYTGPISGFTGATALGNIAGGSSKSLRFTAHFTSTGANATDNNLQGAQTKLDLTWNAIQS